MGRRGITLAATLLAAVLAALFWRILQETRAQLAEGERAQRHAAFVEASGGLSARVEEAHLLLRSLAESPALGELLATRQVGAGASPGDYARLDGELRELADAPGVIRLLLYPAEGGPPLLGYAPGRPAAFPLNETALPLAARDAGRAAGSVTYDLVAGDRVQAAALVVQEAAVIVLVEIEAQGALRSWAQVAHGGAWALVSQGRALAASSPEAGQALAQEDLDSGETVVQGDGVLTSMPLRLPRWSLRARVPMQVAGRVVRELGTILVLATVVVLLVLVIGMAASEARARLSYVQRSLAETERQERFLQAMFDAITDVLIVVDGEGSVVRANRVALEVYGEDLVGKPYAEGLATRSEDHPRDVEALQGVLRSGRPELAEIRAPDGDRVWAVARFPIFGPDTRVQNVVEIARDVSRERQLQAQLIQSEKLSTLGEMAAGIAHEINNPLGVVSMFAQLLIEEIRESLGEDAPALEKVRTIEEQTTNVGEIVKSLLRFARKSEGQHQPFEVRSAVERALSIAEHQKEQRQVQVELELGEPPAAQVVGDDGQLAQVVLNLIVNARHAMNGEGKLAIRVRRQGPDAPDPPGRAFGEVPEGERVLVQVEDSGSGIEAQVIDRLFEPFFTTKPVGEGTGLGLSVSFGIVRDHGGCVWVDSHLGQGTTFTLDLPEAPGEEGEEAAAEAS